MRLKQAIVAAGLAVAMLGAGPSLAQKLSPEQEAKIQPAGKPEHCIQIISIGESRVRDDQTIDFYTRGGKVYRNVLPNSCPELGFERRFAFETSLSELCSVDTITVLHDSPPTRGATCGLGEFQPVTGAPR